MSISGLDPHRMKDAIGCDGKANNVCEVLTVPEILTLVGTGQYFSVVPAFAETLICEGKVVFREIDGMYCDYGLAYEQDSPHPLVKLAVSILLDEFTEERAEAERLQQARSRNDKSETGNKPIQ